MQYIIKHECIDIKYRLTDSFREHEPNPGNNQQRHSEIHGKYVRYFLQGIELLFLGDGERMRVTFKNSESIELKLFPELGPEVFSPLRIEHAVIRDNIT